MVIKGKRKSSNDQTQIGYDTVLPTVRKKPDNSRHKELCERGCKWLKRHDQNIVIPNCATVAVDMVTIENETPDIIGWSSGASVMIEVKVGRGDFLKDRKKPFREICENGVGEFRYYLCLTGLIRGVELPDKWGLLYLNERNKIEIIKVAERQQANLKAERNMLLSLIRRAK